MTDFVPLTAEMLDQVVALEQVAGDVRWSRAQWERELQLGFSRFSIARCSDRLVAYGGYWKVEQEAQLANLIVRPENRHQRLGEQLLRYLLKQAREEGCRCCTLEVRRGNAAALALYRKMGFRVTGQRKHLYHQPSDDAILMELPL